MNLLVFVSWLLFAATWVLLAVHEPILALMVAVLAGAGFVMQIDQKRKRQ